MAVLNGALPGADASLRALLVGAGALTGVVGSVLAFSQRHLKRLLAASTVAHMGVLVGGLGLLDVRAFAGSALYALGHGATKAALFFGVGTLLHRLRSVDEFALRGRGRRMPLTGALFALGGLALAGLPPTGLFLGFARIDRAAQEHGFGWFGLVGFAVAAITGGAVLRAAARVFLGWGSAEPVSDPLQGVVTEPPETRPEKGSTAPAMMLGPIGVLLALAFAVGSSPGLAAGAARAAGQFSDATAYAAAVLDGARATVPSAAAEPLERSAYLKSAVAVLAAIALAAIALLKERLPDRIRRIAAHGRVPIEALRAWHAGDLRDYVGWLAVGAAAFGGLCAALLG